MKYDNQLRLAKNIIAQYDGQTPLSHWLKQFFREYKQAGSKDRKVLSSLVYSYFRLGHHSFSSDDERLRAAISISPDLKLMRDHFGGDVPRIDPMQIFPFGQLSKGVDHSAFSASFLHQPDLFIRVRPGNNERVEHKLSEAGIAYQVCSPTCIRMPNTTRLDAVIDINRDAVIQDKSSQQTGELMLHARQLLGEHKLQVWDCCAASGGKSLMALDTMGNIYITVSDKRTSIIENLHNRFREAGVKAYDYFVADLTSGTFEAPRNKFDLIIADVPCSGSGTWARTPEQLYYFKEEKVDEYARLQKAIASSVLKSLKPKGVLIYLTCSVFSKENEEVVDYIASLGLELLNAKVFAGYNDRADTLFGAVFRNGAV